MNNAFVHPAMVVPSFHAPWPLPHSEGVKVAEDPWFRPPDDVEPNETLYVNNINTRVKEREVKLCMERVCPVSGFPIVTIILDIQTFRILSCYGYVESCSSRSGVDNIRIHRAGKFCARRFAWFVGFWQEASCVVREKS